MSAKWYLPLIITLVGSATTISALAAPIPTESVELWNKPDGTQGMTLSAEQIKAGQTTITATNTSTNEDHELVIVKTDLDPMQFPRTSDQSKVDEGKLKGLREVGDLSPGQSRSKTFKLAPGRYVLFCNEMGHFNAGMYKVLTVVE
jgi:uncharacterized cupredoxin-like copper-binding protein